MLLFDAVGDFVIETGARRDDGYTGVGIEDIYDAAGRDLRLRLSSAAVMQLYTSINGKTGTYLAATHHQDLLIADLPSEYERAAALDLGIRRFHGGGSEIA